MPARRRVVSYWQWQCCACGGSGVNITCPTCPVCGSPRCAYCDTQKVRLGGPSTTRPLFGKASPRGTSPRDSSAASLASLAISYPRAKARHLSILIHGILIETCCADSGSDVNCITGNFARSIGIIVTKKVTYFKLPVTRLRLKATGVASIKCRFPSPPTMAQRVKFFVFDKLQCNVILGRDFLRATRTLDLHQHRLRHIESAPDVPPAVRSVGQVKERVQCWLDGRPVWTLPDTGAAINLISSTFARVLGYSEEKGKPIDSGNRIDVELANGSTVSTVGTIQLSVSFFPPKESNSIVYELVESSYEKTITHEKTEIQRNSQILETFHVLAKVNPKVILGETLLTTVDAYHQHTTNFGLSRRRERAGVAIFRVKKGGEGKKGSTLPLDPKQKFMDDFSLEHDRHLKRKESIEESQQRGSISDDQARVKIVENDRNHFRWFRNNHELLKRFYPGFYERNVPQMIA
jgi:hypothetical protein